MTYDIVEPPHPLLDPVVRELIESGNDGKARVIAQADVAEAVLDAVAADAGGTFTAPVWTNAQAVRAAHAVALQVSYQEVGGIEAWLYESTTRGDRSEGLRPDLPPPHPIAATIVRALVMEAILPEEGRPSDRYRTLTSVRTR